MENKQTPRKSSQKNTSRNVSTRKNFFSSSPVSSYNGIIIAICVAILLWMLLQWDDRNAFKDSNKYRENLPETLNENDEKQHHKIKDIENSVKNSLHHAAETVNNTVHDAINKIKHVGKTDEAKSDESKTSTQNTLKDSFNKVAEKTKEAVDSLKEKAQETVEMQKTKIQETIENFKDTSQAQIDKVKEALSETQISFENRLDMQGLVEQALVTLKEFVSPHLKVEEQIPTKILSGAKAVLFLTIVKGGFGVSGAVGTGIVIARNEKGKWSGPCAIRMTGLDIGLIIGVEKSDHIIILHDPSSIHLFESVGQLKLGLDVAIAAGPKGRDASIALSIGDKGYGAILSYSMAKGAYFGLSFEGQIITVRNDCNEQYYGKKVGAKEILDGSVHPPKNKQLQQIIKIINSYGSR